MEKTRTRKVSETRTLPGKNSLTEVSNKTLANLGSVQEFNERVEKVAQALNVSTKTAREMLKSNDGVLDTYKLRKMIRLALMRSDIANDAIKLIRIAEIVGNNIGDKDEIITREQMKVAHESDEVSL